MMTPKYNSVPVKGVRETGRIPSLDGLRAISVVLVLAAHASLTIGYPASIAPVSRLGGQIGVRVFFVLSGYLITTLLIREEQKVGRVSIKGFYARRILRILPVYVCYLMAVTFFSWAANVPVSSRGLAHAATFTTGWVRGGDWALGHTWSLAVEEQFYLFWPFFFVAVAPLVRLQSAILIACVVPFVRLGLYLSDFGWLVRLSFPGNGDTIMWGCVTALLLPKCQPEVRKLVGGKRGAKLILAVTVVFATEAFHRGHFLPVVSVPLTLSVQSLAIIFVILSVTTNRTGWVFHFLNHPFVTKVGVLSYSLYLWQQLFLYPPSDGYVPYIWQRFPTNLVVASCVAFLSYHLVEAPFLRLKNRMSGSGSIAVAKPLAAIGGRESNLDSKQHHRAA